MFELKLKDLTKNTIFIKKFDSPYLLEQFKKKLKYSKILQIVASD